MFGGAVGHQVATNKGYDGSDGWDYWKYVTGFGLGGGVLGGLAGWGVGSLLTASGAAVAGAGGTATVAGSEIFQTWQQAEEFIRTKLDSVTSQIERTFNTPWGNRILDAFNKSNRIAAEVKYGYVALSDFVRTQIAKDAYLLATNAVQSVEWHFYISQQTGIGGPSTALLSELIKHGFKVIFHC